MKDRSNQNNQKFLWWRNGAQCVGDSMGPPGLQFTPPSDSDRVCLPFASSCSLGKLHSQEIDRTQDRHRWRQSTGLKDHRHHRWRVACACPDDSKYLSSSKMSLLRRGAVWCGSGSSEGWRQECGSRKDGGCRVTTRKVWFEDRLDKVARV